MSYSALHRSELEAEQHDRITINPSSSSSSSSPLGGNPFASAAAPPLSPSSLSGATYTHGDGTATMFGRHSEEDDLIAAAHRPAPDPTTSTSTTASVPLFATPSSSSSSSSSSTSLTSSAYSAVPAGPSAPRPAVGSGSDGVFGHLQALPDGDGKQFTEFEPPSYNEVVREETPPYIESTVVTTVGEDGDVLVEGIPVGDSLTFFINMLISMSFDFVGFLLTSMLAMSHSATHGSRAGLGITLIRYGFLLKARSAEAEVEAYRNDPDNYQTEEQIAVQNEWVAYLMIVVGFFVLLRANAEFIRTQRLKAVILASSEASPA